MSSPYRVGADLVVHATPTPPPPPTRGLPEAAVAGACVLGSAALVGHLGGNVLACVEGTAAGMLAMTACALLGRAVGKWCGS